MGGTAQRGAMSLVKSLKAQTTDMDIAAAVEANSVTDLASMPASCDVLIVSTSSYGEGDPPCNFNLFLLALVRAAKSGTKPLTGMQHTVLGYGSSCYDTFQNTPRLTDKLLGDCGSRRLAQRCEMDDGEDDDNATAYAKFEKDLLEALKNSKPDAPPVCDWKQPQSKILNKTEGDLTGMGMGGGPGPMLVIGGIIAAAGAYAYYNGMLF